MLDDRPHRDRAEHQQRSWQQRNDDADEPNGDDERDEDDPAGAHGRIPAHPLDGGQTLRPHSDEAEILEDVADFVFGEEVRSAVGQQSHQGARGSGGGHHHGHPRAGAQHPGHLCQRRRRFRYQLQHRDGHHRIESLVAERKPLRVRAQETDLRPRLGTHRACQHRLGDIDAESQPVRPRGARQRRRHIAGAAADVEGDAARRDVQPLRRVLPDGHQPAREGLRPVVEHRPDGRGPRRLDGPGVLRRIGVGGRDAAQQVEIALADVGVRRWVGEQFNRPLQRGVHATTLRTELFGEVDEIRRHDIELVRRRCGAPPARGRAPTGGRRTRSSTRQRVPPSGRRDARRRA